MPTDCGQVLGYGLLYLMVAVGMVTTVVFAVNLAFSLHEWMQASRKSS